MESGMPDMDRQREIQAKSRWDRGFGDAADLPFQTYLSGIPQIPLKLVHWTELFPGIVLVDGRQDLVKICKFLGVDLRIQKSEVENYGTATARRTEPVYWMRASFGKETAGLAIRACHKRFEADRLGLTGLEGLGLFAEYRENFRGLSMALACSCNGEPWDRVLCLDFTLSQPFLHFIPEDEARPNLIIPSRLRYPLLSD